MGFEDIKVNIGNNGLFGIGKPASQPATTSATSTPVEITRTSSAPTPLSIDMPADDLKAEFNKAFGVSFSGAKPVETSDKVDYAKIDAEFAANPAKFVETHLGAPVSDVAASASGSLANAYMGFTLARFMPSDDERQRVAKNIESSVPFELIAKGTNVAVA